MGQNSLLMLPKGHIVRYDCQQHARRNIALILYSPAFAWFIPDDLIRNRTAVSRNYFDKLRILTSVAINPLNLESRDTLDSRGHSLFREIGKALPRYAVMLLFTIGITDSAVAQITLRGMVMDSVSKYSLQYVNITIKNTGPGTESDIRGIFELKAGEKDTIVFSRVGYQTRMLPADAVKTLVLIFMKEEPRLLNEVEIKDNRPAWLPPPEPVSPWQNPTFNRPFTDMPGFQGIQTFGPGYGFNMPGSGFKKEV